MLLYLLFHAQWRVGSGSGWKERRGKRSKAINILPILFLLKYAASNYHEPPTCCLLVSSPPSFSPARSSTFRIFSASLVSRALALAPSTQKKKKRSSSSIESFVDLSLSVSLYLSLSLSVSLDGRLSSSSTTIHANLLCHLFGDTNINESPVQSTPTHQAKRGLSSPMNDHHLGLRVRRRISSAGPL